MRFLKLRTLGAKIDKAGFIVKYDRKIGKSKLKLEVTGTIMQYIDMTRLSQTRAINYGSLP